MSDVPEKAPASHDATKVNPPHDATAVNPSDDAAKVPGAEDATRIWDQRYEGNEHVGTQPVIESDPTDYTQHRFLYQHAIAKPQTGSLEGYNLDRVGREFLTPPPARMLALGSGMAFTEEYIVRNNFAQHVTAYEMSPTACERARARFAEAGLSDRIEMRAGDVLEDNLPSGSFDVVFVQAAIHHFDRIDDMFVLMHRVLRPGGLLVYDEYVGPDLHVWTPDIVALLDELNDCLAPAYRMNAHTGTLRERGPIPSREWMLEHDPSEGVHASRILPLTYQYFDVIDRADYGGTIMRGFFSGLLRNFDWSDPKDQTVGRLIVLIEHLMTRHGVIPHYQTSIVARKRAVPRAPLTEEQAARIAYADWPGLPEEPAAPASKAPLSAPSPTPAPQPSPRGVLGRLFGPR
jgi:SAM-dependent methyltransferase